MKFIHIADVHLGAKPDKDKPWGEARARHSWQAFTEVITKAEETQTDLLLIAGDLFHRQPLLLELKEVNYQFSRLTHTQVVLIAGNHDYLNPNSYYRTYVWVPQVHVLKKEEIDYVELPMLRTRVYGLSYWHRELPKPLYQNIEMEEGSFINILLAHGGDEKHIPFRVNDFQKKSFDYVACGHIHKPMQFVEHRVVMAGALQPIDCNDTGEHGFFQGEISQDSCRVTFHPLSYCEYVPLSLKITGENTSSGIEEFVASRIQQSPKHQLFKVILNGFWDVNAPIDIKGIEMLNRVVQVISQCRPEYDIERLKIQYEDQLLGRYIKTLEEKAQNAQKEGTQNEIIQKALYYGVEALLEV
ncbi:MAG: DNA repair exonuclease [Lachnospiraceae bacterium]